MPYKACALLANSSGEKPHQSQIARICLRRQTKNVLRTSISYHAALARTAVRSLPQIPPNTAHTANTACQDTVYPHTTFITVHTAYITQTAYTTHTVTRLALVPEHTDRAHKPRKPRIMPCIPLRATHNTHRRCNTSNIRQGTRIPLIPCIPRIPRMTWCLHL